MPAPPPPALVALDLSDAPLGGGADALGALARALGGGGALGAALVALTLAGCGLALQDFAPFAAAAPPLAPALCALSLADNALGRSAPPAEEMPSLGKSVREAAERRTAVLQYLSGDDAEPGDEAPPPVQI